MKMTAHMLKLKVKFFNIEENNYVIHNYGPENHIGQTTLISSNFATP